MKQVYDPIRLAWVEASPEEVVRQKWLEVMINHLSFPKNLITVEKKLSAIITQITNCSIPNRRIDLLAYCKQGEKLVPLIVLEFKCIPLTQKALFQVNGYNEFIQAPYFAIANDSEIQVGFINSENETQIIHFLPAFSQLTKALKVL